MQLSAARVRVTISAVILATQLANCLAPALAFAQSSSGSSNVQRGQEYYEQSRFDEAISLLKDLVDRGALTGEDLQRARELLARSYVKKGYPVQGKEMFKAILRSNPSWRPDPIRVPPDETAVFDQALKEFQAEGSGTPAPADTSKAATPPTPAPPTTAPAPPKATPTPASTVVPGAATETKEKKKSSKTLWYVLGGAVLIGGIAAAAGGGGGGGGSTPAPASPLPTFPTPPGP